MNNSRARARKGSQVGGQQDFRGKCKTSRLAHRSKEQNALRRAQVATEAALRIQGSGREMLGVELVYLQHLDLGDLEERGSRKQLGRLASLPGWRWRKVVSCLCGVMPV